MIALCLWQLVLDIGYLDGILSALSFPGITRRRSRVVFMPCNVHVCSFLSMSDVKGIMYDVIMLCDIEILQTKFVYICHHVYILNVCDFLICSKLLFYSTCPG